MSGTKSDEGKAPARLFYYDGFNAMHQLKFFREYDKLHTSLVIDKDKDIQLIKMKALESRVLEDMVNEGLDMDDILFGVTRVSQLGATKYGVFNYRDGMRWSRLLDALARHMITYVMGTLRDYESLEDHRLHMLANIYMLAHYIYSESGIDDLRGEKHEIIK